MGWKLTIAKWELGFAKLYLGKTIFWNSNAVFFLKY